VAERLGLKDGVFDELCAGVKKRFEEVSARFSAA
jgi:hypothetical protein